MPVSRRSWVDIAFAIADVIASVIILFVRPTFQSLVYVGLLSIFLLQLRVFIESRDPEPIFAMYDLSEALSRSKKHQLKHKDVKIISANAAYDQGFIEYVDSSVVPGHKVTRLIGSEQWPLAQIVDHVERTWGRLRSGDYNLFFGKTENVGLVVCDIQLASLFVYVGSSDDCLYIESTDRRFILGCLSRFDALTSSGKSISFPTGEELPAAFQEGWVKDWLEQHAIKGRHTP